MSLFFFFNDTATTEIYTLSLHDALPIYRARDEHQSRAEPRGPRPAPPAWRRGARVGPRVSRQRRSEEHTSELQSQSNLVCRLLLEKKNNIQLRDIPSRHYPLASSGRSGH